jgi:hypothetical protein
MDRYIIYAEGSVYILILYFHTFYFYEHLHNLTYSSLKNKGSVVGANLIEMVVSNVCYLIVLVLYPYSIG